ncbi:CHAP domain-containing protein [Streptomyces sp. ADI95-17]|uniref:CHAP domain-containing protein n=1 Tax=Streptomyces sp. ADI95-17 TaxID=1522759 RepID=UPI000F5C145B|nr:CHAP domain-containing protein [Streptomyces sp. ADI95-17]RPK74445.1 CHAP domain protein [Streptomyces sp. ADI95-17]
MSVDGMIKAMERWIGTGEPNTVQEWYRQRNGAAYNYNFPWCNAMVTRAAVESGEYAAVCFGTDYAYTVAHAQRFKEAGQWTAMTNGIAGSGIRRGDIVFFDWDGSSEIGRIDHVGIVTSVSGGYVYTIEGNTANVCARRVRNVHEIAGFGRPKYKPVAPTAGSGSGSKLPQVSLAKLITAAKTDPPKKGTPVSYAGVAIVEKALVAEKLLSAGYADGHWGTATLSAYSLYQQRLGFHGTQPGGDADGRPGKTTLTRLGKAHGFTVTA